VLALRMLLFADVSIGVVCVAEMVQFCSRWQRARPVRVGAVAVVVFVTKQHGHGARSAGSSSGRRGRGVVEVLLPEVASGPAAIMVLAAAAPVLFPAVFVAVGRRITGLFLLVGSCEKRGRSGPEPLSPENFNLAGRPEVFFLLPRMRIQPQYIVDKISQKGRPVAATAEFSAGPIRRLQEAVDGVKTLIPGLYKLGGPTHRSDRQLQFSQVRNLF